MYPLPLSHGRGQRPETRLLGAFLALASLVSCSPATRPPAAKVAWRREALSSAQSSAPSHWPMRLMSAGDRLVVLWRNAEPRHAEQWKLSALSRHDGRALWSSAQPISTWHGGLAADSEGITYAREDGSVRLLDAATGATLWETPELDAQSPVALGRTLVIARLGLSSAGTGLVALDRKSGKRRWRLLATELREGMTLVGAAVLLDDHNTVLVVQSDRFDEATLMALDMASGRPIGGTAGRLPRPYWQLVATPSEVLWAGQDRLLCLERATWRVRWDVPVGCAPAAGADKEEWGRNPLGGPLLVAGDEVVCLALGERSLMTLDRRTGARRRHLDLEGTTVQSSTTALPSLVLRTRSLGQDPRGPGRRVVVEAYALPSLELVQRTEVSRAQATLSNGLPADELHWYLGSGLDVLAFRMPPTHRPVAKAGG